MTTPAAETRREKIRKPMKLVLILNAVVVAVARERSSDAPNVSSKSISDKQSEKEHGKSIPVSRSQEKVDTAVDTEPKAQVHTPSNTTTEDQVPDWKKYTEGDPGDWKKYLQKPEINGTSEESNFDWMKYAGPYIGGMNSTNGTNTTSSNFDWNQYAAPYMGGGQSGSNTTSSGGTGDWQQYAAPYMGGGSTAGSSSGSNTTQWNGGQGDGFGEPFRSQTGGDFRYKAGRTTGGVNPAQPGQSGGQSGQGASDWSQYMGQASTNGTSGGSGGNFDWQQYAGKYMGGSSNATSNSTGGGSGGNFDWQQYAGKYMGGSSNATSNSTGGSGGSSDWQQYMGGAGGSFDWQQYAGKYMGSSASPAVAAVSTVAPSAGGYFELSVTGTDLNVTTSFGLGQGAGSNSTGDGGGGGNQNSIVAKDGKIFIRGTFLNKLVDPAGIVPA